MIIWNWTSVGVLTILSACLTGVGRAQISSYGVSKTGYFTQRSDAAPVLESGENHYFTASVTADGTADLESAIVRTPGGAQVEPAPPFFYFQGFTTQAALDNTFGNGTYSFEITTVDSDIFFGQLGLSGTYPNAPRLANFAAAQSINANQDFTLRWDAFVGGTANDFILVSIDDDTGFTIYESPDRGNPGALSGQDTSVIVPMGTLSPGTNYFCYLSFNRLVTVDTASIPGAVGVAGYARETSLQMKTASSGAALSVNLAGFNRQPDGSFQVQISGTTGATFSLEATVDFTTWTSLITTNPPSGSFSFTDTAAGLLHRFYRAQAN